MLNLVDKLLALGESLNDNLQGTLGRCPPPILFVRTYVVVLEKLSDMYFFIRAQNGF